MQRVQKKSKLVVCLVASLLSACAGTSQSPQARDASAATKQDLTCSLPSNCVSSLGGGMQPLRFVGTPAQAMAFLQATLKSFPEATVVRSETQLLEVIFTTPLGFKDQVNFQIDAQAQHIDFRSRSLLGLYDFGKNSARMQEFKRRFEQQARL